GAHAAALVFAPTVNAARCRNSFVLLLRDVLASVAHFRACRWAALYLARFTPPGVNMSGPLKWEWLLAAGFALVLTHTTASAQDTGSSGVICGGDECITHNGIEDLEERARAEPNNP